jgi:hypothetical protein
MLVSSEHFSGCEMKSKQFLKHSKLGLARLRSSCQSTPLSFLPWYAAALIPNSSQIFLKLEKTGISTFCLPSLLPFSTTLAFAALFLFKATSASMFFLCCAMSTIMVFSYLIHQFFCRNGIPTVAPPFLSRVTQCLHCLAKSNVYKNKSFWLMPS